MAAIRVSRPKQRFPNYFLSKELYRCLFETQKVQLHTSIPQYAQHDHSVPLSPAVRYLVDSNNINVTLLRPTGPRNRLLKGDVLRYLNDTKTNVAKKASEPVKPVIPVESLQSESFVDIQLTNMRKTIAKRLTVSKTTIPYSYSVMECRVDNMFKLRQDILKDSSTKVSINDMIIKAVALSLRKVSQCNANWVNDDVQYLTDVDVSVAVATEGGLITPIVRRVDTLSVVQVSSAIRELSSKARMGKLQPHEYQGGSFSVSNLGMFGIREFTAIINPPQVAILAVGGVRSEPVVSTTGDNIKGVAKLMTVTLSHDCRVIDYELAARWLTVFRNFVEKPYVLNL